MNIATVILNQLGGNKFRVMTGAKDFCSVKETTLQFKLPARFAKNGANLVQITLDASDTYTVRFMKYYKLTVKTISEHSDIYAGSLQMLFTDETGLDTHL